MPGAVVTRVITGYKTGQKNGIKESLLIKSQALFEKIL